MSSEVIESKRRRRKRRSSFIRLSPQTRKFLKVGAWVFVAASLAYVAVVLMWIARDPRWVDQPAPQPTDLQSQVKDPGNQNQGTQHHEVQDRQP